MIGMSSLLAFLAFVSFSSAWNKHMESKYLDSIQLNNQNSLHFFWKFWNNKLCNWSLLARILGKLNICKDLNLSKVFPFPRTTN